MHLYLQTFLPGFSRIIGLLIALLLIRGTIQGQVINTIAGNGTAGFSGDGGLATNASLNAPSSVIIDKTGVIFIADQGNNRIRKVDVNGIITTIAGNGVEDPFGSGDGGLALSAAVYQPVDLALDSKGNLYIATGRLVRKVTLDGIITTVVGNNQLGSTGDGGPAWNAAITPKSIYIDENDNLFINEGPKVRKVDGDGIITTVATPLELTQEDNIGGGVTADNIGAIYYSTSFHFRNDDFNRIHKRAPNGTISSIAGKYVGFGIQRFSGDGGPATNAVMTFNGIGFALDKKGNLLFTANDRIRIIDKNGLINTVAGNGTKGFSGDGGLPTLASLDNPADIYLDANDVAYIADQNNHRIRRTSFNLPPTLVGGGLSSPQSATVGIAFSMPTAYAFSDPEGRALSYSSLSLPTGLSINPTTGVISGTPVNATTSGVTVGATDDAGITVYSGFLLNTRPVLMVVGSGIISPQSATVGAAFSTPTAYAFSAPDGQTLTYSSSSLPAGLSINPTTGLISGTPLNSGTSGITVGATAGATTVYSGFLLNTKTNTLIVVGNGITSPQSATIGKAFSTPTAYAFSAPDGQTLTYSSSSLPAGLSINPTTGLISGTPLNSGTSGITVGATAGATTVYSGFFLNTNLAEGRIGVNPDLTNILQIRVLSNPTMDDQAQLEVKGAMGQSIWLRSFDSQGRQVSSFQIEQAGEVEQTSVALGRGSGLYFIQVSALDQQQTIKVLKQ
ncbi:putative Ig domain-containing protein [uncultured Spirosoma sp.]|uniref:NHL domain-containing protein n=2 Tax=Spirosoma TaxID=107 RepID=UPI00260F6EC1|nr:putative Ig domain-containing protein [uncultured Spirosoma sp.]